MTEKMNYIKKAVERLGKFGLVSGKNFLCLDDVEKMAKQLLAVVKEVKTIERAKEFEARNVEDKFSENEGYYFVDMDGETVFNFFCDDDICTQLSILSNNVFKTKKEAEEHRKEILARYEEAKKKYVRQN